MGHLPYIHTVSLISSFFFSSVCNWEFPRVFLCFLMSLVICPYQMGQLLNSFWSQHQLQWYRRALNRQIVELFSINENKGVNLRSNCCFLTWWKMALICFAWAQNVMLYLYTYFYIAKGRALEVLMCVLGAFIDRNFCWVCWNSLQEGCVYSWCDVCATRLRIGIHMGQERTCCNQLPRHSRCFWLTVGLKKWLDMFELCNLLLQ